MKGLRKIQRAKPPRPRGGLDDPAHLKLVRQMPCLIRGKRGVIRKWVGRYPDVEQVDVDVIHQCSPADKRDAHHVIRKSQMGADKWNTVSLCRSGHALLHTMGQAEFESVFDLDLAAEAKKICPQS